jgi:hypothetical protein
LIEEGDNIGDVTVNEFRGFGGYAIYNRYKGIKNVVKDTLKVMPEVKLRGNEYKRQTRMFMEIKSLFPHHNINVSSLYILLDSYS